MSDPSDPVGTGPLSQIAQAIYHHMALGAWLVLGCAPTLVLLTLLAPSPAAVPFFVLAQLPVAPVLSAGVYAVGAWRSDPEDGPFVLLWRGLRANTLDVLRWWVPTLLAATVLAVNVWASATIPGAQMIRPMAAAAGALLVLWAGQMLVVTTFFSVRTRDAARVAAALLVVRWRVTLVHISLLVVALGVTTLGSEVILALSAWAFVSLLEAVSRPVVVDVTARLQGASQGD